MSELKTPHFGAPWTSAIEGTWPGCVPTSINIRSWSIGASPSKAGTIFGIRHFWNSSRRIRCRGTLPDNIVEVAKVILDAGAEPSAWNQTLMLVSTGSVPRQCGMQLRLIDLLCDYGADPNSALHAAALHGELEALRALLGRGGRIGLPVAAALGRIEEASRLLPGSNGEDRHLAFALAAQFGHVEMVRRLLDAGQNPNRYNPGGC